MTVSKLFTFNIRDFKALAAIYERHGGIILAAQRSWTPSELIDALDRARRLPACAKLD